MGAVGPQDGDHHGDGAHDVERDQTQAPAFQLSSINDYYSAYQCIIITKLINTLIITNMNYNQTGLIAGLRFSPC